MNKPKMTIVSDGCSTQMVLDGVLIAKGISKLEFSTENTTGEQRATIRLLELDLESMELKKADGLLDKFLEQKAAAPLEEARPEY